MKQRIELYDNDLKWVCPYGLSELSPGFAQGWIDCYRSRHGPYLAARRIRNNDNKVMETVQAEIEIRAGMMPAGIGYAWPYLLNAIIRCLHLCLSDAKVHKENKEIVSIIEKTILDLENYIKKRNDQWGQSNL